MAHFGTASHMTGWIVVAAWEGDLDRERAERVLDGRESVDLTAG